MIEYPIIVKQNNEEWPFVLKKNYSIHIPIGGEFTSEWGNLKMGRLNINAEYAFDGATVPVLGNIFPKFKQWFDTQPGIITSALIHDILLQAKKPEPDGFGGTNITYNVCTRAFKWSLNYHNAPYKTVIGNLVAAWFNPVFNHFRDLPLV